MFGRRKSTTEFQLQCYTIEWICFLLRSVQFEIKWIFRGKYHPFINLGIGSNATLNRQQKDDQSSAKNKKTGTKSQSLPRCSLHANFEFGSF